MILSDRSIRDQQRTYGLLDPYIDGNVQPASVDLTLGNEFIRNGSLWRAEEYDMYPGEFMLATTVETVSLPNNLAAQVSGKSSLMRLGLQVCSDAGYIDPGFKGQITLELKNLGHEVIRLVPGQLVCQLVFTLMSSPAEFPYGSAGLKSHYQNQQGVKGSVL